MKKITTPKKKPAPATETPAPAVARKAAAVPKIKVAASPIAAAATLLKPRGFRVTITAKVDVGFGNTLFVRGDGGGLTWEKGTPLECVSDAEWTLVLPSVEKPIAFKFLLNDTVWNTGEDYIAAPGDIVIVTPVF